MAVATTAAIALGVLGPARPSLAGPSDDDLQAAVERYASGAHATYEASLDRRARAGDFVLALDPPVYD